MKLTSVAEFFEKLFLNVSKHNTHSGVKRNYVVNGMGQVVTRNVSLIAVAGSTIEPSQMMTANVAFELASAANIPIMCADNHWFTIRKKPADFTNITLMRSVDTYAMNSVAGDAWSVRPMHMTVLKNLAGTAVSYIPGLEFSHTCIAANATAWREDARNELPFCLSFGLWTTSGDWTNTFLKANLFVKKINEAGGIELTKVTEIPASKFKTFGNFTVPGKFRLYTNIDKADLFSAMPADAASLYHPHIYIELVFQNYRIWTADIRLEETFYPSVTVPRPLTEVIPESATLFTQQRVQTMPIVTGTSLTSTSYSTLQTGATMESTPSFTPIAAVWPTGGTPPVFAAGANPSATNQYCLNFLTGDGSSLRISCRDDTNGRSISQLEYKLSSNAIRFSLPNT